MASATGKSKERNNFLPLNSNNTEDLKLNAVSVAEETVHLTSADEHRTFFSLTDIGGGYRDDVGVPEKQVIYLGLKAHAEADRQRHIDSGWYTPEEIQLETMGRLHAGKPLLLAQLRVIRHGIRSQYNRIPLHLMVGYAKKNDIVFKSRFDKDEFDPKFPKEQTQVRLHNGKEAIALKKFTVTSK